MSRLRLAVIGAGNIARQHLAVLTNHPECDVVALCDGDPRMLEATGERFGIGQRLHDADELLGRDDIDAVYVLVSVLAVATVAGKFIDAGMPTLLEKPPGIYSSDTARLAELQQKRGTVAMVGLNRRFHANQLETKRRLAEVGPIAMVTVDAHEDLNAASRERFSPLVIRRWPYANGIHVLDLLRFFGGDVAEVESHVNTIENDFPDSFSATLRFADGALGRAALDLFGPGGHRYEVRTVGATAISAVPEPNWLGSTVLRVRDRPDETLEPDEDDRNYKAGFWKQASSFLGGVRAGRQPPWPAPDLADAHKTMVMIDQICKLPAAPE
jgi:predicted dehydrogenase